MRGCWWGPSCGQRYWGDFYSDPPDCSDPCDCHGNYTGGGNSWSGGYASGYTGGYTGGSCRNCGGGHGGYGGMPNAEPNTVSESDQLVSPGPTKTNGQPHRAVRP